MQKPAIGPGVVVLLSGGVDSAIMTGLAWEAGESIRPLFVRQGFVWENEEIEAVLRFLDSLHGTGKGQIHPLNILDLKAPSDASIQWAQDTSAPFLPLDEPDENFFLPGRNLALITMGALQAYSAGVGRIQLGILASNPFPDSSDKFFDLLEATISEGMDWPVKIERPLALISKSEVLRRGQHFALELTLSCIRPIGPLHCGECGKCRERYDAFKKAGIDDPTPYAKPLNR